MPESRMTAPSVPLEETINKYRDHPLYEAGYWDGWYGRRHCLKTRPEPYLAGYRAATHARQLFEAAGFKRNRSGVYSKTLALPAPPDDARPEGGDD